MKRMISAACLAAACLLSGCASSGYEPASKANVIETNYQAADALLKGVALAPGKPILVATLVNLDVLTESSRLGRLFSEQLISRFANRGLTVKELKLRDNLFVKQGEGELLLSREIGEISRVHNAQAVVVGTYATSGSTLYVNLKLVQTEGNVILSAYDYSLPMDENLRGLLRGARAAQANW